MKYVFIVNPSAGTENSVGAISEAINRSERKDQCEIYVTKGVNDATEHVRAYCEKHPEEKVRFIACGGDGTLNEVVNGAVGQENAEVSCYPCGSGNDFVKCFEDPERFKDIDKLLSAKARKIDLLKVGDRYSDNVVNFGFDTTVAISVNEGRARGGNAAKNAYTMGIIKALITSMKNEFEVYADGELINPDGKALLCTVANGQYVGGSFKCAPRAELDDGYMEVCLVKPISRIRFVKLLDTYTKGKHLDDPKLQDIMIYRKARKVRVKAKKGFAYSLDGEIIYDPDFTIEIAEKVLDFAAPEN
ncbi:MAG: diacylglycerol kinase family lipid kinase [Erysipelotrichaceae bacterium]|nr:diacylglycerol kinase family lipid kinase [Erysipelotrichaceae bacterium]MBR2827452.1 diacylglycerol kinase family lipid kinase [Erysipelotrichaceae bacterium]